MVKNIFLIFLILFLASLAIIVWGNSQAVLFLKQIFSEPLRPLEIVLNKIQGNVSFWQSTLINIRQIKKSNMNLAAENLELYGKLVKLSQLEEENIILKEQLNLNKKNINAKQAKVIGYDFQNNRSFLIDKGTNDGITNGATVILKDEIIIGRIADAGYKSAKVQTILDTQTRIAAITLKSRASGLVRGLGSSVVFDLIAKNKNPETGELIISSGTDGVWPYGFIIGKVKEVKVSDGQIFNTADIDMLIDIPSLINVFVIIGNQ